MINNVGFVSPVVMSTLWVVLNTRYQCISVSAFIYEAVCSYKGDHVLTDVSHLSRELSRVCLGGERDSLLSESQQS